MNSLRRLRLAVAFLCIAELAIGSSWAQQTDAKDDPPPQEASDPAQDSDKLAADRFLQILLRRPRAGATFDKTYAYYNDQGTLDDLTNDLEKRFSDGNSGNVATLLGLIAMQGGRDATAIEWFQRAEEKLPQDAIPSFYLAQCYLIVGRKADAIGAFERAVKKRPAKADAFQILEELGRVYQRDREPEKALAVWRQLEQMFPSDLQVQQQIAKVLIEEGDISGAAERFDRLAELAKTSVQKVEMRWRAAKLRLTLDDPKAAQRELEQLVGQVNPDSWLHEAIRSDIDSGYIDNRNFDGLVKNYAGWIERHPEDLDAMLRLAKYLPAEDTAQAKEWVGRAIERAPSSTAALSVMADLQERELDFAAASETMKRLVELEPSNVDFVQRYGQCVARNTKIEEDKRRAQAIEIWRSMRRASKGNAVAVVRIAELLRGIGAKEEAIEFYSEAIRLAEDEPQYREYLGEYLHQLGQTDEALAVWREIATGDRATRDNYLRLSEVLLKFKLPEEALDAMKEACELKPLFSHRIQYAIALRDAKRFSESLEQLDAAGEMATTPEERLRFWNEQIATFEESKSLAKQTREFETRIGNIANVPGEDWLRLALMQEKLRNPNAAARSIRRAIAAMPDSRIANDIAVRIFTLNREPNASRSALERLIEIDSRSKATYLVRVIELLIAQKDLNSALAKARDLISTSGANEEHYSLFADVCFRLDMNEEGLAALRRNLRLNPNSQLALSSLATRLAKINKLDEAIELTWRALEASSSSDQMRSSMETLVGYYRQATSLNQFRERLKKLSSRGFRQREIALVSAYGLQLIGETQLAMERLNGLLVGDAMDRELLVELVKMAALRTDYIKAVEYQKRLREIEPSRQADLRLAEFEFAAGKTLEALELLQNYAGKKASEDDFLKLIQDLEASNNYWAAAKTSAVAVTEFPDDWELLTRALINNHRAGSAELANQYAEKILSLKLPFETPTRALANLNALHQASDRTAWLARSLALDEKLDIPPIVLQHGVANLPQDIRNLEEIREWEARRTRRSARNANANQSASQTRRVVQTNRATNGAASAPQSLNAKIDLICYGDAQAIALTLPLITNHTNEEAEVKAAVSKCASAEASQSKDELWTAIFLLNRAGQESSTLHQRIVDNLVEMKDRGAIAIAINELRSIVMFFGSVSSNFQVLTGSSSKQNVSLSDADRSRFQKALKVQSEVEGKVDFKTAVVLSMLQFKAGAKPEANEAIELALNANATAVEYLQLAPEVMEHSMDAAGRLIAESLKVDMSSNYYSLFAKTLEQFSLKLSEANLESDLPPKMLGTMIDLQAERNASLDGTAWTLSDQQVNNPKRTQNPAADPILFSEVLCTSDLLPAALKLTVMTLSRDGQSSEAKEWLKTKVSACASDPHQLATALCCLAYSQWLSDDPAALDSIREAQATQIAPNVLKLYESQMLLSLKRPREALELVSKIDASHALLDRECRGVVLNAAIDLKDTDLATKALKRFLIETADQTKRLDLAVAMLRLGMVDEAKASLKSLNSISNETLYIPLLNVYSQYAFKNEARDLCEQILSTVTPSEILAVLKYPLEVEGRIAKPPRVNRNNFDDRLRGQALKTLVAAGDMSATIQRFKELLAKSPLSAPVNVALVDMYRAVGNEIEAEDVIAEYRGNSTGSPTTLLQIARAYSSSERHRLAVKIYLKALRLRPDALKELNSVRSSVIESDCLPFFCKQLQELGFENFNGQQFMLYSVGREVLKSNDKVTTLSYTSALLDHFGIVAIPRLTGLSSKPRAERFDFFTDALVEKLASKLVAHCKQNDSARLDNVIESGRELGAWEAVFSSLQKYPEVRARVLSEILGIDDQQRSESAKLMLTLLLADSDRDGEAEQQFEAILSSPSIASKLGVKAIFDMYFVLSMDLGKPEMSARVLERALSNATDELHIELLKSVQKKAAEGLVTKVSKD